MNPITIDTPDGPIAGMTSGPSTGRLVLGLHGWSQRNGWHTWQPLMAPLGGVGYRVVSVDMPGWGGSPAWERPMSDPDAAVAAVLSIISSLDVSGAALMGKSWGGAVAVEVALRHPARVSQLILTAPAYGQMERLQSVVQPVLLVWAEDDPVIPVARAHQIAAVLPDAELVLYPRGGHSAAPKNAADFAPRAIAFLGSPEQASTQRDRSDYAD